MQPVLHGRDVVLLAQSNPDNIEVDRPAPELFRRQYEDDGIVQPDLRGLYRVGDAFPDASPFLLRFDRRERGWPADVLETWVLHTVPQVDVGEFD